MSRWFWLILLSFIAAAVAAAAAAAAANQQPQQDGIPGRRPRQLREGVKLVRKLRRKKMMASSSPDSPRLRDDQPLKVRRKRPLAAAAAAAAADGDPVPNLRGPSANVALPPRRQQQEARRKLKLRRKKKKKVVPRPSANLVGVVPAPPVAPTVAPALFPNAAPPEENVNNRTEDEKRCKVKDLGLQSCCQSSYPYFSLSLSRIHSPVPVHDRELPERPLRLRQRQQRHLLLLLRLLKPGRNRFRVMRVGIRSLLPL